MLIGNIVLVYALMVPVLCPVVSAGYERKCKLLLSALNGPTAEYTEALASQQLSSDLNEVLEIVKIVNFIETRPLKARLFRRLCDKLGAEHNNLLFYCNSRWLSKVKVFFVCTN